VDRPIRFATEEGCHAPPFGDLIPCLFNAAAIDRSVVDVRSALLAFDPLWNELFPAEQSRIIELLVERVDVRTDRVDIKLRIDGVTSLLGELTGNSITKQDAA
jgi:hypothetical protein